jgi:hypothetical protein
MIRTLKQFRKENPELKGKRIILCEHLKNKSIDNVDVNLWLGDNTRLLLCPVCQKVMVGTAFAFVDNIHSELIQIFDLTKGTEYKDWLEKAGKEKS